MAPRANPVFPVRAQVYYFFVLCWAARKDPKYIPPSPWRFLSMVVKKQCRAGIAAKHAPLSLSATGSLPEQQLAGSGKGSGTR